MSRENGYKVIALIAFLLGVVGLTVGFAAFSRTLNISSATVNTTARTNVFETAIHYTGTPTSSNLSNITVTSAGTSSGDTWSGISFTIDSDKTSASATFTATVQNESADYDAYLKTIKSVNTGSDAGKIVCTASTGTNASLVATACSKMSMTITVAGGGTNNGTATATSLAAANATMANSVILAKGGTRTVTVQFTYNNDTPLPDGQYTVTLPAIQFEYTSTPIGA